jgi:hypothetical protein
VTDCCARSSMILVLDPKLQVRKLWYHTELLDLCICVNELLSLRLSPLPSVRSPPDEDEWIPSSFVCTAFPLPYRSRHDSIRHHIRDAITGAAPLSHIGFLAIRLHVNLMWREVWIQSQFVTIEISHRSRRGVLFER